MSDTTTPASALRLERRVALVIGCAAYENARPLQAPTGDAARMSSLLEGLGFEVISGFNCDYIDFRKRFNQFKTAMTGTDLALFYFSGHGVQDAEQRNFLLPVDAEIELPEDLDRTSVPLDRIMTAIRVEQGVAGVILLDACRDNPFAVQREGGQAKSVLANRRGLTAPDKASMHNILIAFATGAGETARDGDQQKPSPFTEALLRHLGSPGKAITSSLIAVRNEVREATGFKQVPWSQDSLLREIILKPAGDSLLCSTSPILQPPPVLKSTSVVEDNSIPQQPINPQTLISPVNLNRADSAKIWGLPLQPRARAHMIGSFLLLIIGLAAFSMNRRIPEPCTYADASSCRWWVIVGSEFNPNNDDTGPANAKVNRTLADCQFKAFSDWSRKWKDFIPDYTASVLGAYRSKAEAEKVLRAAKECVRDAYVKESVYSGE